MNNIEILEDLEKYISFANKQSNFSNDADYKWHKELAGMIENLIKENKELKEENLKLHSEIANEVYFSSSPAKENNMSEIKKQEILEKTENILYELNAIVLDDYDRKEHRENAQEIIYVIEGLLDLYNKEKEKNKQLFEEYQKRVSKIIMYEQTIKEAIDEFTDVLEV